MQCRYSNRTTRYYSAAFGFNETRICQVNFTSRKCLNVATVKTITFPCILFLSANIGIIERFLGGQCNGGIPIVLPVTTVQLLDSMKLELVKSISLQESV
jgi:hypothetical protein